MSLFSFTPEEKDGKRDARDGIGQEGGGDEGKRGNKWDHVRPKGTAEIEVAEEGDWKEEEQGQGGSLN